MHTPSRQITNEHILLGFYLGIGDFLSAVPVFQRLRKFGHPLTVVASPVNLRMVELLDVADAEIDWIPFSRFSFSSIRSAFRLLSELWRRSPDTVVVSSHAAGHVSSWRLPLMLKLLRLSTWRRTRVVGGEGQRLSRLFDERLAIDFSRGLVHREWRMHQDLGTIPATDQPCDRVFRFDVRNQPLRYDLVIHPGASRDNKRWPVSRYVELLDRLNADMEIAFLGLPSELGPIRAAVGDRPGIDWVSVELAASVRVMASGRMIMTMDSGFAHVASFLNRPHLAVFGSTDPDLFAPRSTSTRILYRKHLDCQPCNAHICPVAGIPCMKTISAKDAAGEISRRLDVQRTD